MDEVDTLVKTDDDGVVNNDDDDAPTVEETYEITSTRRKTIRTSYKIQEVSSWLIICVRNLYVGWSQLLRFPLWRRSVGVYIVNNRISEILKRDDVRDKISAFKNENVDLFVYNYRH